MTIITRETKFRALAVLLYVATALLVYHKRVGWQSPDDVHWIQLGLRPDVWFGLVIIVAIVLSPKWIFSPKEHVTAQKVLVVAPVLAILSAFVGTAVGHFEYGVEFSSFGDQVALRLFICTALGLIVYNLGIRSRLFRGRVQFLLKWTPLASGLIAIFAILLPELVPIVFSKDWLTEGPGIFSYGHRFQGLTSNPNIVATTSCVAAALLLPEILDRMRTLSLGFWVRTCYLSVLLAVIAWSGVRASLLILAVVIAAALWLRFKPTARGIGTLAVAAFGIAAFLFMACLVLSHAGILGELVDRLKAGDGRLFLWSRYSRILAENPFGLGFGYETIVHTDQVIAGQRLPPHNTILEMAMYGGFLGALAHVASWFWIARSVGRLKRIAGGRIPTSLQGLVLGWIATSVSLLFAGLIFTDYTFVVLTALLLVGFRLVDDRNLSNSL